MLLQLKKIDKFKFKKKNLKAKTIKRLRKIFKYKNSPNNLKLIQLKKEAKNSKLKLVIRVTPNNIFCTLINVTKKEIICNKSAGIYKIQVSKKKIKFAHKIILVKFLDTIKNKLGNNLIIIKIIGPIKIRKSIIKCLSLNLKQNNLILHTAPLKCFNGCRPAKKRRKKQKGLRVFK
jgi:ribosomal protein S11